MKIHNQLELFKECMNRWEKRPTPDQFDREYAIPLSQTMGDFFEDYYEMLRRFDWAAYRKHVMPMDPAKEEARLRRNIEAVENLFQFPLKGEVFLISTFYGMDGYARFDRGTHKVYLGIDENYHRNYIDVLTIHELTHVARESRPEVWEGFGLNPKMTQDEFTDSQPVIEHLMGEGFSCAISEILVPGEPQWDYAYQSRESLELILSQPKTLDRIIHSELKKPDGDYGHLYGISPQFAHYYWAFQWVKAVLKDFADNDPKKLVARCSKDFHAHALQFFLNQGFLKDGRA